MSTQWELPNHEKPRERAKAYGVKALADYELIALLLGSGVHDKGVMAVAQEIMMRFGSLANLREATLVELESIKGIGEARAILLQASLELGIRANAASRSGVILKKPQEVYEHLHARLRVLDHEELWALYLTARGELIDQKVISQGSLNRTAVDPASVFKWALKLSAPAVILVHNHPSGDPHPSRDDQELTRLMVLAGKMLNVTVLDHLIIGRTGYHSFAEAGGLEPEGWIDKAVKKGQDVS